MKFFQLGLIVAVALFALLGSCLWVLAQEAPPDSAPADIAPTAETSGVQALGLRVTTTVGIIANTCSTTNTVVVKVNTTVYYCYTLQHTGVGGDESFTLHNVRTSRGVSRDNLSLTLNPGEVRNTVSAGFVFSEIVAADVTNFVTWTARPADNDPLVTVNSNARVDVVAPAISVEKTVGLDRTSCAAARTLTVPSNTGVAFCITIQNRGDITLTNHNLIDGPQSINVTFDYPLPPTGRLSIYPANLSTITRLSTGLERIISSAFINDVSVTSRLQADRTDVSASGTSTASISIGNTTVIFTKTISTQPEDCAGRNSLSVNPGTIVYYCAQIKNTGVVTLTQHQLREDNLSINVSFDYPLPPGGVLNVTNDFLARNNQPIVFGPFELNPAFGNTIVNGTMSYTGKSPDGFTATGSAATSSTYIPTPTRTNTPGPRSTSTFTPFPTNTPFNTPIPPTPTFTLTPTPSPVTPSPTPTRSYAISLLETPTPRVQPASIPQGVPQLDPSQQFTPDPFAQPTPDPFAQPTPFTDGQLPAQEPAIATATQIAIDATSTAVAAVATAAQVAIDSANATALAETQAIVPDSPLPTPTLDPSLSQAGDSSGLPVAPGLESTPSPEATPDAAATAAALPVVTVAPTEEVPLVTLPDADALTVLPPVITAVIATATPEVVVLVVTNTPEPAQILLPDSQRPIVPPTPTTTPDFVMAAARTFDVAVTTLGWLWFLVGSLVFFVTAGIVAGLFFRQSEVNRYDLAESDYWLEEEAPDDEYPPYAGPPPGPNPGRQTRQSADEDWPADLL